MKSGPAALAIESLLYPFLLFVFTPFILDAIGTGDYGVWSYMNAAISAGSVFSFGTAMAAIHMLSSQLGVCAKADSDRTIRSILLMFLLQGVAVALVVCVLAVGILSDRHASSYMLASLLLYGVALSILEQMDIAVGSILRAGQHFSAMLRYDVVVRIVQLGLAYGAARLAGLEAMLLVFVVVAMLRLGLKLAVARKLMFREFRWYGAVGLGPIAAQAKYGWIQGGMGGIMFFADRLFAGNLLGPQAVALLSVLTLIPQQFHAVAVAAIGYVYPRMAKDRSAGQVDWARARASMLRLTAVIFMLMALAGVLLYLLSEWFLALWLKGRFGPDISLLFVLVFCSYLLQVVNAPSFFLLGAFGCNTALTVLMSVAGLLSLLLLEPMFQRYGVYGAAYGKIIYGLLCLSMVAYVLVRRNEN